MPDPTSTPLYEKLLAAARAPADEPAPRASVAVIPWRRTPERGLEVFWVRRAPTMQFMGGWYAFPGGGVARRDAAVPVDGEPAETAAGRVTDPLPGLDEDARARLGPDLAPGVVPAALRELFEETGLLLTSPAGAPAPEALAPARRRLLAKEADFAALAAEQGWRLTAAPLVFAGRWLTPPVAPVRFDNRFFLLEWPADRRPQPELLGGEHDHGEWTAPAAAVERWEAGEAIAAPPIVHALRVLAEDGPEKGLARLHDPREADLGPMRRIEFRPGVVLLPLRTLTLPPATHTNAYLLGLGEVVLVDPASTLPGEVAALKQAVAAAQAQGRRVRAIWLTHHHPDHVGAVNAMREELGVPVLAHPATAERLAPRGIAVDGALHDGERVELAGFPVRVFHTPGHARGHLCFYDERRGSLLAGDLIAGLGTIVIDPPEGDMDEYLRSLERMIELAPKTLFPAHGPVVLESVAKLTEYRDHRLWREERIVEAWREGLRTPRAMVARVYEDVPAEVHPVAERQIEAHLVRLRRLGRIEA